MKTKSNLLIDFGLIIWGKISVLKLPKRARNGQNVKINHTVFMLIIY